MALVKDAEVDRDLAREELAELDLAFAPLHKRCLGAAIGTATGLLLFALTLLHMLRSPDEPYPLVLLAQYFVGYSISWTGAFVGLLWGFWVGFVLGWFFAFARNLVLALTAVVFRVRAELSQDQGFLDNI